MGTELLIKELKKVHNKVVREYHREKSIPMEEFIRRGKIDEFLAQDDKLFDKQQLIKQLHFLIKAVDKEQSSYPLYFRIPYEDLENYNPKELK